MDSAINGQAAEAILRELAASIKLVQPGDSRAAAELGRALTLLADSFGPEIKGLLLDAGAVLSAASSVAGGMPAALTKAVETVNKAVALLPVCSPGLDLAQGSDSSGNTMARGDLGLVRDFVSESLDYLAGAEADILKLEAAQDTAEHINSLFRHFHTIKGMSAFLNFDIITELAGSGENLLSTARSGDIAVSPEYCACLLRATDCLKELIMHVLKLNPGEKLAKPEGFDELLGAIKNFKSIAPQEIRKPQDPRPPVRAPESGGPDAAKPASHAEHAKTESGEQYIRVKTEKLDFLTEAVGELVISHAMVAHDPALSSPEMRSFLNKVVGTGKIIRRLQDLAISLRMVSLKASFQKITRAVHDLSAKTGKPVSLRLSGEQAEIDRNIVEALDSFLIHLIRNAIDHGLEDAAARIRLDKPVAGTIGISAYSEGSTMVFRIYDDGGGLDAEKIKSHAIKKGLITANSQLDKEAVCGLIFTPGFSTADKVSDISGRGVGMDVVKSGVEGLGGKITVESLPSKGTTFTIRLPLTTAVTEGLLVKVGAQKFILPLQNIARTFRPAGGDLSAAPGGGEVVALAEGTAAVFRIADLFGIFGAVNDAAQGTLVLAADLQPPCAFLVDDVLGKHQVVVKPLSKGAASEGVAGGAILGDGNVTLILDLRALARRGTCGDLSARGKEKSGAAQNKHLVKCL